ncbi:MAG: enoyl-CoA hydratase [Actinobacteria bacterium]|nr:MAG: enoyl-CoA hydratase [Actinomycetota bacterium]
MTQAEAHAAWRAFDVQVDERTGVATVTLAGTAAGNAMGGLVWSELPSVFEALDADPAARAVVLRGAGDCFSVGLDLRWYVPRYRRMVRAGEGSPDVSQQLLDEATWMQDAIGALPASRLPVVVAVHGSCIGAGLDLAAAGDIRLASADAVFSLREVRIGIVADLGVLQRLPRIVGAGHTRELALTGRDVSAAEARSMGLVTKVLATPSALFEEANAVATRIAGYPPQTVAGIKQVVERTQDMPLAEGLRHVALWNAAFLPSPGLTDLLTAALRGE